MSQKESKAIFQKWQHSLVDWVKKAESAIQSNPRQRKMSAEILVQSLVLGCLEQEKNSLRLWCQTASDLGCEIKASSLDERLTKRLVELLHEVLQLSIQDSLQVPSLPVAALKDFSRVILYDSSLLSLPSAFKEVFRGSGSNKELGQMKLQVGYDYLNAQLSALQIHEGIDPDQKDEGLLAQAVQDALLVFDLGYFEQHLFAKIQARGAYFLSRYQSQCHLYEPETGALVDIADCLKNTKAAQFETYLLLGAKSKTLLRLVARRVSQQEAEKRRRQLKRKAEQGGYTASSRSLLLCDWEILISNLGPDWSLQALLDLYRLRWQIELIFKAWKTYLDLSRYGNWRFERILAQVYATLIAAVLVLRRRVTQVLTIIRHHWWGFYTWLRNLQKELLKFGQQQKLETAPSSLGRINALGLNLMPIDTSIRPYR
jgi:hypothetical protein